MTTPGSFGRPGDNPFDRPPLDSSVESLNSYFARQPAAPGGDPAGGNPFGGNPLGPPELFVRPPQPTPRRRSSGIIVGVVAVALVAACCGGLVWAFDGDDEDKSDPTARAAATASRSPSASPSRTWSPTPTRTATTPPPTAAPSPSANPLDSVKVSQCLKNNGTDADPDMVPATCGKGTYRVLKRLYGTSDPSPCRQVSGTNTYYTVTYYRNYVPDISRSYVFCLKKL